MARSVILSNGGLTVGLDEHGLVHDFYYPYVGLENLTNARQEPHRVGIWVDGEFSWIDEDSWERSVSFRDSALISTITVKNSELDIELGIEDFVDIDSDIFARKVHVHNASNTDREIRLFFHQVFQISADGRGDTAMFVPDGPYLLDYKGRCSILAYAETSDGQVFDQYAVGNAGIEGKEGTFRDAEDGELSMSTVEHASVDSTLRVTLQVGHGESEKVHYWLAVADSQTELEKLHETMLGSGFSARMEATSTAWRNWLSTAEPRLKDMPDEYKTAVNKSLLTIKAHMDNDGGIIASCDSSIYNYGRDYYSYVWPRDGAYAIWPLIKLGYTLEAKKFFVFCRSIMHKDGYMMHKYQPDRAIGSTWHPLIHGKSKELAIQEDETASIIFILGEYLDYTQDNKFVSALFDSMVRPMADFLSRYMDKETGLPHASYDLWEEKFLTNTYSVAITYAALKTALRLAEIEGYEDTAAWSQAIDSMSASAPTLFSNDEGHYAKGFLLSQEGTKSYDNVLDVSSLYGAHIANYGTQEFLKATQTAIERDLLDISPSQGAARYEDDNYFASTPKYKGNPWFVTTLWMAQYYADIGQPDKTREYIDWALQNTLESGVLSEQIAPENSQIVGVTPLVWSHAELINAILKL